MGSSGVAKLGLLLKAKNAKEKVVYKNLSITYGLKILSIVISFLQIRISLDFLSSSVYGLWLTIISFTSWVSILDLGFGNGMRNKLTAAIAENDIITARKYLSTGYILIGGLFLGVILIVSPLILFTEWQKLLHISNDEAAKIKLSLLIVFVSFCLQFVLKLVTSVYFAYQKVARADVFAFISQALIFIVILILKLFAKQGSLLAFSVIFSIIPLLTYAVVNFFAFKNRFKQLTPSFAFFKKAYIKDISQIGGQFFVIQISALIMYSTDNVIINYFLGAESVTQYSIPYRLFIFVVLAFQLILPPYWSMIIKAAKEKDIHWINNAVKKLIVIWFIFTAGSIVMLLFSTQLYKIWLGSNIAVPFSLSLMLMIYSAVSGWVSIFNTVLYALNKIKLQFYMAVASIILNIPICVLLLKSTSLGLLSLPIVMTLHTVIFGIMLPIKMKRNLRTWIYDTASNNLTTRPL